MEIYSLTINIRDAFNETPTLGEKNTNPSKKENPKLRRNESTCDLAAKRKRYWHKEDYNNCCKLSTTNLTWISPMPWHILRNLASGVPLDKFFTTTIDVSGKEASLS